MDPTDQQSFLEFLPTDYITTMQCLQFYAQIIKNFGPDSNLGKSACAVTSHLRYRYIIYSTEDVCPEDYDYFLFYESRYPQFSVEGYYSKVIHRCKFLSRKEDDAPPVVEEFVRPEIDQCSEVPDMSEDQSEEEDLPLDTPTEVCASPPPRDIAAEMLSSLQELNRTLTAEIDKIYPPQDCVESETYPLDCVDESPSEDVENVSVYDGSSEGCDDSEEGSDGYPSDDDDFIQQSVPHVKLDGVKPASENGTPQFGKEFQYASPPFERIVPAMSFGDLYADSWIPNSEDQEYYQEYRNFNNSVANYRLTFDRSRVGHRVGKLLEAFGHSIYVTESILLLTRADHNFDSLEERAFVAFGARTSEAFMT